MTFRRALAGVAASVALIAVSGSARAASVTIASAADQLGPTGTAATFTGGSGGTLFVPSSPGTSGIPTVVTFNPSNTFDANFTMTPISATSGATAIPGGKFAETTTGGSFSFASGSTVYLSGTFTGGVLTVANKDTSVGLLSTGANSVTYTGGTFLSLAGLTPGAIGAFSLGFSAANTGSGTGVGVGSFIDQWVAHGFSGTFDALNGRGGNGAVPEPSSLAGFAIAVILLGGTLVIRRRRRVPHIA